MTQLPERWLAEIARIAADSGPALAPVGHDELLRSITETARGLFSAGACSLALLTDDESELVFHVASGAGADAVVGLRVPVTRGVAGWVVTSGSPIGIEDVSQDPRFAHDLAEETGYRPSSILAMPLQTERQTFGVIEVLDRDTTGRDGRSDMQLLALVANQAALAIESSRVFSNLGHVLLEALARRSEAEDLTQAVEAVIAKVSGPNQDLAEITSLFNELGSSGPDERRLATKVLRDFLIYTKEKRWRS